MIFDQREHLEAYLPAPLGELLTGFLRGLSPDMPDGDYPLGDQGVVARVLGYETRPKAETRLEAHRKYADVQCVFIGAEQVQRYANQGLEVLEAYDGRKDVEFFRFPQAEPVSLELNPHTFAVFLPQDAHVGQLPVGDETGKPIRKVVFKVPVLLLTPSVKGAHLHA